MKSELSTPKYNIQLLFIFVPVDSTVVFSSCFCHEMQFAMLNANHFSQKKVQYLQSYLQLEHQYWI